MQRMFSKWVACIVLSCACSLPAFAGCIKQGGFSSGWESWEPYQYKSHNILIGLDVELLAVIMKKMDCSLSFSEINWKRHLILLESGMIDIAAGASKTPDRVRYAYFSLPYRMERMSLIVPINTSKTITSFDDIVKKHFTLGITRGYFYGDDFESHLKNPEFASFIQDVAEESDNYQKLIEHQIDGFMADAFVANSLLKSPDYAKQFKKSGFEVQTGEIYIMLSKRTTTPAILGVLNQALGELKEKGELNKITQKYL